MASRTFAVRLGLIVAAALALRVLHTLLVAPWPPDNFGDELYYSSVANLISLGEGFVRPAELINSSLSVPTAERAPLYPYTLAGLAELGGNGEDAQRLVGAVTGSVTVAALGLLGRRLAGDTAGLIAAGLAALYPTLIAADGALMTESLYGMLAALALLAAYRLRDAPAPGRAVVLGLVLGLAALTRGEALFLLPLLLVPLLRRPGGLKAGAVVVVAFALVLTPWTIRNWTTFDRPVLVATEAGETIAGANCESAYYGDFLGKWDVNCVQIADGTSPGFNEAVEFNEAGRDGIRYALDHPARVPVVAAVRLARTWGLWSPFQVAEGRSQTVVRVGVLVYLVLAALAVYGFVLLRRRGIPIWIVCTPLITVTLTALVAYGSVRFRHSAELSLVVLAAVAVAQLAGRSEAPEGQRVA